MPTFAFIKIVCVRHRSKVRVLMVIATRTLESGFPQSNEGSFADRTHAVTENKIITQTNSTAARYRGGGSEKSQSEGMRMVGSVCNHSAGSRTSVSLCCSLSSPHTYL